MSIPDSPGYAQKDNLGPSIKNMNWKEFFDSYDNAVACLKQMLNPKVLENLQKIK